MMRKIDIAAIDLAADMVMAFHVNKEKEWSPDRTINNYPEFRVHDQDELYLMAQMLFPVVLVRYAAGLPLVEDEHG